MQTSCCGCCKLPREFQSFQQDSSFPRPYQWPPEPYPAVLSKVAELLLLSDKLRKELSESNSGLPLELNCDCCAINHSRCSCTCPCKPCQKIEEKSYYSNPCRTTPSACARCRPEMTPYRGPDKISSACLANRQFLDGCIPATKGNTNLRGSASWSSALTMFDETGDPSSKCIKMDPVSSLPPPPPYSAVCGQPPVQGAGAGDMTQFNGLGSNFEEPFPEVCAYLEGTHTLADPAGLRFPRNDLLTAGQQSGLWPIPFDPNYVSSFDVATPCISPSRRQNKMVFQNRSSRVRVALACKECRKTKRRCSAELPCKRCLKNGVECILSKSKYIKA